MQTSRPRSRLALGHLAAIGLLVLLTGCSSASAPPAPTPNHAELWARQAELEREVAALRGRFAAEPAAPSSAVASLDPEDFFPPAPSAKVECEAGATPTPKGFAQGRIRTCFDAEGRVHGPFVIVELEDGLSTVPFRAHFRAGVLHGRLYSNHNGSGGFGQFVDGKAVGTWIEPVQLVVRPRFSLHQQKSYLAQQKSYLEQQKQSSAGLEHFPPTPRWHVTQPGVRPSALTQAISGWLDYAASVRRGEAAVPAETPAETEDLGAALRRAINELAGGPTREPHWLGRGEYRNGLRTGVWHLRQNVRRKREKPANSVWKARGYVAYKNSATLTFREGKPIGTMTLVENGETMTGTFDSNGRPTGIWDMGVVTSFQDGLVTQVKGEDGAMTRLPVVDGRYEGAVNLGDGDLTFSLVAGHPVGSWVERSAPDRATNYHFDDEGRLHGAWRQEAPPDGVSSEGQYCRGELCGVWRAYKAKNIIRQVSFKDDVLDGPTKKWSPSGRLIETTAFRKGLRHGPAVQWRDSDDSDRVVFKGTYKAGKKEGRWTEGNRWRGTETGHYRKGGRHGSWTTCPEKIEWLEGCGSVRYVDGALSGPVVLNDGSKRIETQVRTSPQSKTVVHGSYAVYRGDVVVRKGVFEMGHRVGEWTENRADGALQKRLQCVKTPSAEASQCRVTEARHATGGLRFSATKTGSKGLWRDRYWDADGTLSGDLIVDSKGNSCGAYMLVDDDDGSKVIGRFIPAATGEACVADGRFTETSRDGAVHVHHYKAGQRTGRWEWRDSSGNVTRWVEYEQGSEA
ncbi:MAG: antitoxin component YwqK of YwqJK toxin-antitoxin module, partial [Myxococcota bacterium]